ncbi:MAG: LemA family protein [Paludibacteraceae bacterium]|nr:LemA family protein [Paludibacteraceae bacterium]MBR6305066.1 LemA family protein [Paludibacteraceae bacterium]
MKKFLPWIVVLGVLAIIVLWIANVYNGLVAGEEQVESAWAQVENQYQRRADLVPNLVATVKGYAEHEKETLDNVVSARARATEITIDPANATPEQLAAYQAAQGELSQALGKLLAIAENYPDLKANENFRDLQQQLEGTENRITVARQLFNDDARAFNTKVRRFPNNIIANMFGFEKKPYFEAEEGANKAPEVAF